VRAAWHPRGSGWSARRGLPARGPQRQLALRVVVVGGRRHAQDPADRLDTETTAIRVDERGGFGRPASSSVAKNTLAAFRISFARRSSKFSRFRRLISSRSSLLGRSGRSRRPPRLDGRAFATSLSRRRVHARYARSADRTPTRDERRAATAPRDTWMIGASTDGLLSGGQIFLHSKPPSNPASLISIGHRGPPRLVTPVPRVTSYRLGRRRGALVGLGHPASVYPPPRSARPAGRRIGSAELEN
jgi:hypothetical protein